MQEFFSFNFPLREFFFCTSGDPLPIFSEEGGTSVQRLSPAVFSRLPSLSDSASPVDAQVS